MSLSDLALRRDFSPRRRNTQLNSAQLRFEATFALFRCWMLAAVHSPPSKGVGGQVTASSRCNGRCSCSRQLFFVECSR